MTVAEKRHPFTILIWNAINSNLGWKYNLKNVDRAKILKLLKAKILKFHTILKNFNPFLLFLFTIIVHGLKKYQFNDLLSLATKESYFIFNNILFKQIDGVAMGSPLGTSLANTFLAYYEQNWLAL